MTVRSLPLMTKRIFGVVPLIAVFLIVIELILANTFAGMKDDARRADVAIQELENTRDIMVQETASASALATISQKAADLGFQEPSQSQYVVLDPLFVAALPKGDLPKLQYTEKTQN